MQFIVSEIRLDQDRKRESETVLTRVVDTYDEGMTFAAARAVEVNGAWILDDGGTLVAQVENGCRYWWVVDPVG